MRIKVIKTTASYIVLITLICLCIWLLQICLSSQTGSDIGVPVFMNTVLCGVFVYVAGEMISKLIIDPTVAFKEQLGELSSLFLLHQATIISASFSKEVQAELRKLSSAVLAKKQAITGYWVAERFFYLPSQDEVLGICHSVNQIAYQIDEHQGDSVKKNLSMAIINEQMAKMHKNIIIKYSV